MKRVPTRCRGYAALFILAGVLMLTSCGTGMPEPGHRTQTRVMEGEGDIPLRVTFRPSCAIPGGTIEGQVDTEPGIGGGISATSFHERQPPSNRLDWTPEDNVDGVIPFNLAVPEGAPLGGDPVILAAAVVDADPAKEEIRRSARAGMELEVARAC